MTTRKKAHTEKGAIGEPKGGSGRNTCFVISPIGQSGTERYRKFKDALEYIIKPGVRSSGYELEVLRADDIDRPGSFIKDILQSLYDSYVVIADLTEQNPNVFYELGVRHALSPRTILIAQSIDDIPSDLREYRTIVYDTSARGAAEFCNRLKQYLSEMHKDPERPDNPVLDRIGSIIENRIATLEVEKQQLKNDLSVVLQKGAPKQKGSSSPSVLTRVSRIAKLFGAEEQMFDARFSRGRRDCVLPAGQGKFRLYLIEKEDSIEEFWYLSSHSDSFDHKDDLADARVLMQNCADQGGIECKFIIATNDDLGDRRMEIEVMFRKMKAKLPPAYRGRCVLEIWDCVGLLEVEKALGLRV